MKKAYSTYGTQTHKKQKGNKAHHCRNHQITKKDSKKEKNKGAIKCLENN